MRNGKCSILSVIFIFFILFVVAAVLFPVCIRDGDCSHRATCQSNLKQCAQALKMYSDDYDGQMPSSYLISRSKRWNSPDFLMFATRLGEYPPRSNRKHTIWQVLYDNMKNNDIQWCPSDEADHADPRARTSYWYKLANDKAWYGIGCSKPRRSMQDYAYESDQIAFYEHKGWHFGDTKGLHNNVQVNASFVDTHVEVIVIKNATSGDPIDCAANTDGEPMYYNFKTDAEPTPYRYQVKAHNHEFLQKGPATLTDPSFCSDAL